MSRKVEELDALEIDQLMGFPDNWESLSRSEDRIREKKIGNGELHFNDTDNTGGWNDYFWQTVLEKVVCSRYELPIGITVYPKM